MGCDIHVHIEALQSIDQHKVWVNVDHWKIDHYKESDSGFNIVPIYRNRDYHLFSVLANVRNYSDMKPICNPRGLPEDVSDHTKKESDLWNGDGHSHSWFTLKELLDYKEANPKIKYAGLMTPENAALVDAGGMPTSWCQGCSDPTYVHRKWEREEDVFHYLIPEIEERLREVFWVFGDGKYNIELAGKTRIVFWFDN